MATVTIQIVASGNTVGRTKAVSGADLVRFLAAYKTLLGKVVDSQGPPITYRDMTDDETVLAWADGLLAGTKANVKRAEQDAAAKTASNAITEIALT